MNTVLLLAALMSGDLSVENYQSGEEVRHPVILLRGDSNGAPTLQNESSNSPALCTGHHAGRWKALVRLQPGPNVIQIADDRSSQRVTIRYKEQTNKYYVRMVWMTDDSGDPAFAVPNDDHPQEYAARLRTAAELMQTFTAEQMHALGYGRRTFRLERDKDGSVIVHTLKAPRSKDYYYSIPDGRWWGETNRWINSQHADPYAKNVVIAAFTRKEPETKRMLAHTALGGGNLGLFGSASVFAWPTSLETSMKAFSDTTAVDPTRVHDDSVGRSVYWGLASTTIGATLHEMGHTFGLPHCRDSRCIMTRGFDRFNRFFTVVEPRSKRNRDPIEFGRDHEAYFAPVSASFLRWSRWFEGNERAWKSDARPVIHWNSEERTVRISSPSGVPWAGFWTQDSIDGFREFKDSPTQIELSLDEIEPMLKNGRPLTRVSAVGANGQHAVLRIPESKGD